MLREIGGSGQKRLDAACVALVGLGGLGSPAALYLAAAGVGHLILIDDDQVELSNLQRQILYVSADVGRTKAQVARDRLAALDPDLKVVSQCERVTGDNAKRLLEGADVVLDGSDSFATRIAVNAACHELGLALVSGAVGRWEGEVAVFRPGGILPDGGQSPCYQCLHASHPEDQEDCATVGIVGALPGLIGATMALEAVKLITSAGEPLLGRVWRLDGLTMRSVRLMLPHNPACPQCGKSDLMQVKPLAPAR
jgi:molybdopterin/thiamine biosynthesis adenylyltransferase